MDQDNGGVDYDRLRQALVAALEPLDHLRLDPAQIKLGAKLGAGGFGDVFHATRKIRGTWYKSAKASVVVKRLRAEGTDEQRLRIVAALARELVIQDTASGIAYLHSLKPPVCHGDIKPENTLVNQLGRALICDFGLAKAVDDRPSGLTTTAQPFTARYASPEVLQDASVRTLPSDVWSWGCLVYQLIFQQIPYHNMGSLGAIYAAATTGISPASLDTDASSDIVSLIKSCWFFSPEERPTMTKCERAILEARPDYRKVAAHFHGVAGINPRELPDAFKMETEGIQVTYNPDLERTVRIASLTDLKIPKVPRSPEMRCFSFSPDGKVVIAGGASRITCYTGSTISVIQTLSLVKNVTPLLACSSSGAEAIAYVDESGKIYILDRLAWKTKSIVDASGSFRVVAMLFDHSGKHIITFKDNSLSVLHVDNAGDEPAKRIASGIQSISDISSKHPVIAVAPYEDQILLLNIPDGGVLQVFETSGKAAFTPDGLSLAIQHPESGDPMIWEFRAAEHEAGSFSLSSDGPRGQFVEVGRIQCPKSPSFRKISFSSDGLLGCGSYFDYAANPTCWVVHVWSMESKETLLTMTYDDPKQTVRQVYLRPGSTLAGGHIDFVHQNASTFLAHIIQGSFGFRVAYSGTTTKEKAPLRDTSS